MKSKTKILISLALLIIFLFSGIFNSRISKNIITNNNYIEFNEKDQVQINQSGFWELTGSPIYINDLATGVGAHNWTWAETQPWCSGSGNWTAPYVIENVTIDGQGSSDCIEIKNSDSYFIIRNCSLYNSGPSTINAGIKLDNVDSGKIINNSCSDSNINGIYLVSSNNNTLSGNNANNNNDGIYLYHSNNNTLSGNNANNNYNHGIYLWQSNNNTISGNTANSNNYCGIGIYESNNSTFSENLMYFCGIYLSGSLAEMASQIIDNTNLVNNKPVYYYTNELGLGSSNFTNAGQIILINCCNSIISGFNLSNGTTGIYLIYSNNNTLSGNTASINTYGIILVESNNNTLSGNTASNNNRRGIGLSSSNNNTLSGNTANNNGEGIYLWDSNNNTISGNTASNNNYGISLDKSNNNTFSGNTASNNNIFGIYLYNSDNNTLSGNTASNNNDRGILLDSSNNNKIFLNHFINNGINAEDNGINNIWDNGFIGNYWSDYTGVDANYDGIGDTPYLVPGTAGSQDNFPIYDDIAPVITIIFPLPDSIFGLDAPNYNIFIDELYLDTIWYTLDGGITNYTITALTGMFNQLVWEALSEGSLTIRFYAKDTAGNIGSAAVTVEKDISAPVITVILPLFDSIFGLEAPNYQITVDELNLDTIWYTLDGGITNYTITDLTGTFNQTAWEALSEGSLTIRFYAKDKAGNINFKDVEVIIEIPEDVDDLPIISFGNYYILFAFITILSFIILEKRKKK